MNRRQRFLDGLGALLFRSPGRSRGARAFFVLLAVALLLAGTLHWVAFFNFGELRLTAHDWPLQHMYLSILQEAVTTPQVPYHISDYPFYGRPQFLAVPETILSPQILLLRRLSLGHFVFANVLLLYGLSFVGCLLIHRKYHLSPVAFSVLFLLFNFNGHITAHLGAGHPWYGYFLLPFFFLGTLQLAEGKADAEPNKHRNLSELQWRQQPRPIRTQRRKWQSHEL